MHRPPRRCPPLPRAGEEVRTTKKEPLRLGDRIGGGLQGSVFAVEGDPDCCVKVYGSLPAAGELAVRERITRLAALPPAEALVLPTVALEVPHVGYVMPRVHGHRPIGDLCDPQPVDRGLQDLPSWMVETGGLRKRLLLGQRLARSFQDLHTRGLHYGDISFGNLLVSLSGPTSLRLIDCDNLSLSGACDMGVQGTPWFIAPEILIHNQRPSATTDAWSLAVLLYLMLTLRHPLLGDGVRRGAPAGEEEALRGRFVYPSPPERPLQPEVGAQVGDPLPWVDHPTDDRNRSTAGIGPTHMVSPGLMRLFDRAFTHGVRDPHQRPTEGEWAEALGRAADAVLLCAPCGATSYLGARETCPWCDKALVAPGLLHIWHADGCRPLTVERSRLLYPRHLAGRIGAVDDQPVAEVTLEAHGLRLTARTAELRVWPPGGKDVVAQRVLPGRSTVLARGASFTLTERGPRAEVVRP
jgi:DNA-binding helix-hairpin-helix protein with protein kinase domain